MVKNGEAYHASNPHLDSSRPRNLFNPSTNFCGLLTYLQSYIISDLKWVMPGFSHGDTSDSLKWRIDTIFGDRNWNDYFAVSLDGSAFDSNQHSELIQAVDQQFYRLYLPWLEKIVKMVLRENDLPLSNFDLIMEGIFWQFNTLDF